MIFYSRRKYDVVPLLSTELGNQAEVLEQHKMLGQIVRSDLFFLLQILNLFATRLINNVVYQKDEIHGLPQVRIAGSLKATNSLGL